MKFLRLLLRVLLAVVVLATVIVLLVAGPLRGRVSDYARRRVVQMLQAGLREPVSIGALRIQLLPPTIEVGAVTIGKGGALARSARVTIHIQPRISFSRLRPVADAVVDDVFVDIPQWVDVLDKPGSSPPGAIPPFLLREVRINRAHVRVSPGAEPLELNAETLVGMLEADPFGMLHFAADGQGAVLSRSGERLELQRLRGSGGETLDGWRLTEVELVGDGVQLASSPASGDRLPIRGRVALPRLAFATDLFKRLEGEAKIDAALIGKLDEPRAAGDVRVAPLLVDGNRLGDVSASLQWDLHKLVVSKGRLQDAEGEAELSGELGMDAPFDYQAQVRWAGLDMNRLAQLPERVVKPLRGDGEAQLSGALEPLDVRAIGSGRFTPVAGGDVIEWRGNAGFRDGAGGGEIEASQTAANTVRAQLDIGADRALTGSVHTAVARPDILGAFFPIEAVPSITGSMSASAQVTGTVDNPRLHGEVAGRGVVLLGVGIDTLGGAFTADRAALHTPGITAKLWQGSVDLTGTVALDARTVNDWTLRAVDVPGDAVVGVTYALTGQVVPIGRGTLMAGVTARGPWPAVQFNGNAEMQNFWLTCQWIVSAAVQGSAQWPQWQLTGTMRNSAEQTLVLRGNGRGVDDVALTAQSSGWQLTALQRGELTETGGTLVLDASLRGPLEALDGRAVVQGRELIVSGRSIGTADLEAIATRGRWQVSGVLLGGAVQLRGRLTPETGWPVQLNADWTSAEFGPLLVPDSEVHVVSSGTLQITTRLAAPAQFDATLQMPELRIVNGPYELALVQPALLDCRRGACAVRELHLRGVNTDLQVGGVISASGAVNLHLDGQGDLRLLELAGGTVVSSRGNFSADVDVERTAGRWDVTGRIRIEQAALDVGAPLAITRANGRLTLAGTTMHVDELSGRIGTGTFNVGGTIDLERGPDLEWTVSEVGADLMPSLEAEFSGSGSVGGTWEHLLLSGDVEVARMLYDRDLELTDFLPRLNRALADAPRREGARRIDLDLHMVAPGALYVENNIARIEARADIRVQGTAARPVLQGRIEALDGTVTFRDRVFELEGGTIDFRPDLGLAAALNITASSTIDTPDATYVVDVRITGTTREPRVTMSSDDPSLSPTDIATLIAVGKTTAQLRESGGGFSVYDALAAVPSQLSRPLEQGTKQLLPIDRISFESTYSRTTGTFEPQLKLGKDLTDNLAVSVGQTFGVESRSMVGADYRLTPRVFIPLTWESETSVQEGAFGAGVKVRYEFWRATPYTLLRGWR